MSIQGTGHHIHGGHFYNVGGDVNLHSHQHLTIQNHELHAAALSLTWSGGDGRAGGSRQQPLMIQDLGSTSEILHDSADSLPRLRSQPESRTQMQSDTILRWWNDSSHSVLWLPEHWSGTLVVRNLCQSLEDSNRLGGAFFFQKDHPTRGNAKQLFSTLAYQLALKNRHLKPVISQCVEDDPSVVGRHMSVQLRKLVVDPLKTLRDSGPQIFVIDGLDECDTPDTQVEIL
jgi:hypothetical protein